MNWLQFDFRNFLQQYLCLPSSWLSMIDTMIEWNNLSFSFLNLTMLTEAVITVFIQYDDDTVWQYNLPFFLLRGITSWYQTSFEALLLFDYNITLMLIIKPFQREISDRKHLQDNPCNIIEDNEYNPLNIFAAFSLHPHVIFVSSVIMRLWIMLLSDHM